MNIAFAEIRRAISYNGFGINEVAEGIAKQYRETISCIPCYAMSRPEGVASITGIISEAVMAKGSDRRERFRHNKLYANLLILCYK